MSHRGLVLVLALAACGPKQPQVEAPAPEAPAAEAPEAEGPAVAEAPEAEATPEPPPPAAVDTHELVNDAVALLENGTPGAIRRAVPMLEAAVRNDPNDAWAVFNLGAAVELAGDPAAALRHYQRATELDPAMGHAWRMQGVAHERAGRLDLAISTFRTGISADPENMALRASLVNALRLGGRHQEAITEARAALAIQGDDLAVYNAMGLVYLDLEDLHLARWVFEMAVLLHGGELDPLIRANLGWTLYGLGERASALQHLNEARVLDPDLLPPLIYLAHIYLDARNYQDMLPLLEEAANKAPENHGVLMNLGIAYRGVERYEDAVRIYQKALEVDPNNPDPWFNLGVLYGDYVKDYDKSIEAFNRYIDGRGDERELARTYLSDVQAEKEQVELRRQRQLEAEEAERQRQEAARERERLLREAEEAERRAEEAEGRAEEPEGHDQEGEE